MDFNLEVLYEKIQKRRSFIMGVSILWVVLFHCGLDLNLPGFGFIKQAGYAGVDIFLFLSGMGIYCSLRKNKELLPFYFRRIKRIMVPYLPMFVIWFIGKVYVEYQAGNATDVFVYVKSFVGNIIMLGWFNNIPLTFIWYAQTLMWFYLVSPILFEIIQKCERKKKYYFLFFLFLVITQLVFMDFYLTLMGVSRIFVYVMGMLFSHLYFEHKDIKVKLPIVISMILMVLGFILLYLSFHIFKDYLWTFGMWWYPVIPMTPGLVIIFGAIGNLLSNNKMSNHLVKGLDYLGECSWEIMIVQVVFFSMLTDFIAVDTNMKWFVFSVAAIIFGVIYHIVLNKIVFHKEGK